MSDTHRRVYHPRLNAWQDVPKSDGDKWKAAGWRLTKPEHADDSEALPPGEHPGYAQVPVLEDTSRTTTPAPTAGATTPAAPATGTSSA